MKAKHLLDVCEQLEYMARIGRESAKGIHPDAEVMITEKNAPILAIAEWMWALAPKR